MPFERASSQRMGERVGRSSSSSGRNHPGSRCAANRRTWGDAGRARTAKEQRPGGSSRAAGAHRRHRATFGPPQPRPPGGPARLARP
jgi:hypothetical protein